MRKKKIFLLIALLIIGFAAVSATLVLNGAVKLGFNANDFDVYFSASTLNGVDKKSEFISSNGKELNFTTDELSLVGDKAVIYYEITNASRYYDASVKMVCDDFNDDKVSVTNVLNSELIKAQTSSDGVLVTELISPVVGSETVKLKCRIEATPITREEIANDNVEGDVTTYSLYGYYVDDNGESIANTNLVIYSSTPHFVHTDDRGYFYVDGLEKGSHEIYHVPEIENIENKNKDEIKSLASSNAVFTTSSGNILFNDNSKIKDVVLELTNNVSYNIVLKTSSGTIINENYQVTHNHPYGNLPTVDVSNSSFIHWTLEDGTVISNDSLVATKDPHELIAVISPVVAPVIQASTTNWTTNDVTISIITPGSAAKGIKHYEYLITKNENPGSQDTPTGTTDGNITVSSVGVNHVYYRTVASDDVKSGWSEGIVTKIDKTAPTNVSFSNKVVAGDNVTMNVNYTENESNVTNTKCYYGDASSQIKEGTFSNGTCVYPTSAEYAKVCVTNAVGKETCSTSKKLADYIVKSGVPQVEFEVKVPERGISEFSQENGYSYLKFGDKSGPSGRGGINTKEPIDTTNYARMYADTEYYYETTGSNPDFAIWLRDDGWTWEKGRTWLVFYMARYGDEVVNIKKTENRKTLSSVMDNSDGHLPYMMIGKNSSKLYGELKIYNIWFQLTN